MEEFINFSIMKMTILLILMAVISLNGYSLEPKRGYEFTPEDFGMDFDSFKVDGLTGWWLKPIDDKSKKCMIFSHDGVGNMADHLEVASSYISLGYHVIMYDYRGYGTSDQMKISTKFYMYSQFANDLTAVLDWVKKYHSVWEVDMAGVGIGGGLAVAIACNREEVKYAIGDGVYLSLDKVQKAFDEVKGEKILIPLGYDKGYMEPWSALERGSHLKGILLICSSGDLLITSTQTQELALRNKKKTEVYVVNSETNAENFSVNKDAYYDRIKEFLGL